MKKLLAVLAVAMLLTTFMLAQQRSGNIEGKITTADGQALPGVLVTLTSDVSAKLTAVTNEVGLFRFRELAPSRSYVVSAELEGFNKAIKTGIQVALGVNSKVDLIMELGQIEKEVIVEGKAAVVDAKSTQVNSIVTREELQSIPTGRDPFIVMAMAPGVQTDRQNMAGSESGQQASSVGRGESGYSNTIWNVDGINVTDPAAIGATPTYWDFDAFEEMNVSTGGADVTIQSGGIALNMVTRRGGNIHRLGGRFYMTDEKFQKEVPAAELKKYNVAGYVGVRNIKDYGFNLGGPIVKDKVFYWMSYGVQDIKTKTITGSKDDTLLTNYAGKLNIQLIEANRLEIFFHSGGKTKEGRSSSTAWPLGLGQGGQTYFGSPIIKFQDEHTFGDNLFLSLKYAFSDAGFKLWPMNDANYEKLARIDVTSGVWYDHSGFIYDVKRPKHNYAMQLTYFNDNLFGGSHEIKLGAEYTKAHEGVKSGYSGSTTCYYHFNYDSPQLDLDGDGNNDMVPGWGLFDVWRDWGGMTYIDTYSAFLQDTMTFGNLTVKVGLRYDYLNPFLTAFSVKAIDKNKCFTDNLDANVLTALDKFIPGAEVPEMKAGDWAIGYISPRIGFTYDMKGDGTTILKLSAAMYGSVYGTGLSTNLKPFGTGGWLNFWHNDVNGDKKISLNEMYWFEYTDTGSKIPKPMFDAAGNFIGDTDAMYYEAWGGYTWGSAATTPSRDLIDGKNNSPKTYEVLATFEKELSRDLSVQINGTYRMTNGNRWRVSYYNDTKKMADGPEWWYKAGTIPATINGLGSTGDAAGKPYWLPSADAKASSYTINTPRTDLKDTYYAVDLVLTKRLSNKWMAQGSVTMQTQSRTYGDSYGGFRNGTILTSPTNMWALEDNVYAPAVGASSGKIDQLVFSPWMFKMTGLYQLPWDFNISFNFTAHAGNIIPRYFSIKDYTSPNSTYNTTTVYTEKLGKTRNPTLTVLDLRLEKMIKVSDTQRVYLMADLFNVFNSNIVDRRRDWNYGTYYVYADTSKNKWVPNALSGKVEGLLNPMVLRFGVRFQF